MSQDDHGSKRPPFIPIQPSHPVQHEEGEGNWLVSYADMMTLLVGFFVILLSFATFDQAKLELAKQSVTQEFGGSYKRPFDDVKKRIQDALDKKGIGDQFVVKQSDDGVEISFQGTVFFETGSADIKPEAKNSVEQLIPIIEAESKEFDIKIEGHTDDVPLIPGRFLKNNWELSSMRACRVLDAFFANGKFDPKHMTAIGYGESRPVVPNRDEQGEAIPENQKENRRVVIKLIKNSTPALGGGNPTSTAQLSQ